MLDTETVSVRQTQMYVLGNKLFVFEPHIKYELYENEWYYGIIFHVENDGDFMYPYGRYDVVHHYHMDWERLIINNKQGWKDMPFHAGTYRFLPDGIKVLEL